MIDDSGVFCNQVNASISLSEYASEVVCAPSTIAGRMDVSRKDVKINAKKYDSHLANFVFWM